MVEVICSLLVLLFLYTSISKLLDFKHFIANMNNQPFPNWITPWLVRILPATEILIVAGLLFEKTRLAALWASFLVMLLFTIYTLLVLLHFFGWVPCSCGGVITQLTWGQHLVFNLFFTGISLAGIILKKREHGNGPAASPAPIE
jgi:hypothetical protein